MNTSKKIISVLLALLTLASVSNNSTYAMKRRKKVPASSLLSVIESEKRGHYALDEDDRSLDDIIDEGIFIVKQRKKSEYFKFSLLTMLDQGNEEVIDITKPDSMRISSQESTPQESTPQESTPQESTPQESTPQEIATSISSSLEDPSCYEFELLTTSAIEILERENKMVTPQKGASIVVGDLHGNKEATECIINYIRDLFEKGEIASAVFLGDYVDRSSNSYSVIAQVLSFKIAFPDKVFLLQGNHETEGVFPCDFIEELHIKFPVCAKEIEWILYGELFPELPLAAEIVTDNGKKILCVHGGIPKVELYKEFKEMEATKCEVDDNLCKQLLWSDFSADANYIENNVVRGSGCVFNAQAVNDFATAFGYSAILRGHQYRKKDKGFKKAPQTNFYTIFSSPNYGKNDDNPYGDDNDAAIAMVTDSGEIKKISLKKI